MRKTVIAVRGVSDSGKSTSIRLAYDELKKDATVINPGEPARERPKGPPEVKGAILEIDGVLVGFASPGDKAEILRPYLEDLKTKGCTVIVCATHTWGGTVRLVESLQPEFVVDWTDKASPQVNHADGNRKTADVIIEKVRRAVVNAQLIEV